VAQSLVGGQGQYEVTVMAFDQFLNEDVQTVNITVVSTSPDSDTVSTQPPVSQSTQQVSSQQRTPVTSTVTPTTPVATEPTTTAYIGLHFGLFSPNFNAVFTFERNKPNVHGFLYAEVSIRLIL
jgi:hypothetical protein